MPTGPRCSTSSQWSVRTSPGVTCLRKPKEYVDKIVATVKDLWKLLDVSYDRFIRTTDDYHMESCQKIFTKLYEQGQ